MDVLTFYLDDTAPVITRRLSLQSGEGFNVTSGAQFHLRMRALWSSVVVLDVLMAPDVDTDELSYRPTAGDLNQEGVYRAWIYVDLGGGVVQNTDEFNINVFAHAPGQGVPIGAVYRAARALEPVSWESLRNFPEYGDLELQRVIDLAKLRLMGTVVPAADEDSLDDRIVDYLAKRVLVDNVLYAAVSFWSDQVVQQSARGNSDEIKTYPDRIRTAQEARKRYLEDLERQEGEVTKLLGSSSSAYDAPALDTTGPLLTPGLDEYPAMPVSLPYWNGRR
jgi:hypothetical protein